LVSSVISAKTGINYPDLEPGNELWNWVKLLRFLLQITTDNIKICLYWVRPECSVHLLCNFDTLYLSVVGT